MGKARTMEESVAGRAGLYEAARSIGVSKNDRRTWTTGTDPHGNAINSSGLDNGNVVGANLSGHARYNYSWHDPHVGL